MDIHGKKCERAQQCSKVSLKVLQGVLSAFYSTGWLVVKATSIMEDTFNYEICTYMANNARELNIVAKYLSKCHRVLQ
jgi:hypothetical protein